MRRQFTVIAVTALVVGGVGGAGMSYAMAPAVQAPNANGVISSCYTTASGAIRLVDRAASCGAGEQKLTWSQGLKKPVVHQVGAAGQVPYVDTFTSHFKAYNGPPFGNLSYFKDASGVVHLTGLACQRDNETGLCDSSRLLGGTLEVFQLPKGFRPNAQQVFTTLSDGLGDYLHTRIDVTTAGVVKVIAPPDTGLDWISFDGVSFLAR